jgi:anti-sigma B factor antagonist
MTIEQRMVGSVAVLDLKGRLALGDGAGLLKDKVNSLIFQGHTQIVFNLENVPIIDSTGLGELVASRVSVIDKAGGQLKVCNLTKRVSDLLVITRLLTVLDVHETEAEAIRSMSEAV